MSDSLKEICIKMWIEYEPGLRKYCRAKLVNYQDDADDILSKTFQLFWNELLTEGVPPYPEKWLYKTAYNLIRAEYTKRSRCKWKFSPYEDNEIVISCIDDVDDLITDEQVYSELLKDLKEKLSDDEKEILKLAVIENKSYAEIARILDISEIAAKQRKYRLVQKTQKMKKEKLKKFGLI